MEVSELLAKKRQLLLKDEDGKVASVIVDPDKSERSKDGKYIYVGDYYSDETRGWYDIEAIAKSVVSVVKEFEPEPQEPLQKGFYWWPFGA